MFQSVVNVDLNLGVPGDIVLDEPSRIQPVTLAAAAAIGLFLTVANNTGLASPGVALAGDLSCTAVLPCCRRSSRCLVAPLSTPSTRT
jgi:hypothetical protein